LDSIFLERISKNLLALVDQNQQDMALILGELAEIIKNEKSQEVDKEALYKQVQILTEQALLPPSRRKKMLVSAALLYFSSFLSVPEIGTFLVRYKNQLDELFDGH